jgi:DNA-binding response OmpR family regulator
MSQVAGIERKTRDVRPGPAADDQLHGEYVWLSREEVRMTAGTAGRVLVVDDEQPLARLVGEYLTRDGFAVNLAFDGSDAVRAAREQTPDVVVLDLGLPGLDGVEVCRQLRTFTDCYVLMLTARSDEVDKLIGLSVGADDYMTKPFSPRELVARVHVLLRRPRQPATATVAPDERLHFGSLGLDVAAREVSVGGDLVELTRTEFDVLAALAARPRVVFTRRQLIDAVWGDEWFGDEHLVDVHIGHLRRKLGDDAEAARFVRTVRGVGYRMGDG